jgi:hypothetical protein
VLSTDIVERFQLGLMLSVIAVRNMIEMSGSDLAFLPKSFVKGKSLLDTILSVCDSHLYCPPPADATVFISPSLSLFCQKWRSTG